MSAYLDNPPTVAWSHSDRLADFYELPTDGKEMHEALGWLLQHYESVVLWMGVESEDGTELYLTASPPQQEAVVDRLTKYADDVSVFEAGMTVEGGDQSGLSRLPSARKPAMQRVEK